MDFRELRYVVALAKYQNVTKAAHSLYVGQPTLTKSIQNLERSLGQKLFRKLGNRFLLTYAGEVYLKKAEQILLLKKELDQELSDIIQSDIGVLKVAFPMMRGTYMLPCTIPAFYRLYPNVRLDIVEADSDLLEDMLLKGETDLAFFNLPIHSSSIGYEIIRREEILLVLSAGHPLAKRAVFRENSPYPWLSLELLRDEKFILFTKAQRTRQLADSLFAQYHMKPDVFLETRNIQAALTLAASGYGACFVSETHLKHIPFSAPPLLFSVGKGNTTLDFVAAFRKNAYLPYHAKEYIQIVRDFT